MQDQEMDVRTYAQMLQDGLDEITAWEPFQRFLRFLANNPNYSPRNVLLILQQKPEATRTKGFKGWLKEGRCVREGQRGIRINANFQRNDEEELLPPNQRKRKRNRPFGFLSRGTFRGMGKSIGRSLGRGGRATAKPTGSRRSSADGFAVTMKRTKAGAGLTNPVPRFRRRNGNGENPDNQGVKSGDFFVPCAKKYYSSLDGLDRRNGHRTEIVFSGEMCYTWVSKLTSVTRRMELNEQSNVFNKK